MIVEMIDRSLGSRYAKLPTLVSSRKAAAGIRGQSPDGYGASSCRERARGTVIATRGLE